MFTTAIDVITKSVPAAAHLVCLGYKPLRTETRAGFTAIIFPAAAEAALDEFIAAKRRVDAWVAQTPPEAPAR
jgi:hypothetical protein